MYNYSKLRMPYAIIFPEGILSQQNWSHFQVFLQLSAHHTTGPLMQSGRDLRRFPDMGSAATPIEESRAEDQNLPSSQSQPLLNGILGTARVFMTGVAKDDQNQMGRGEQLQPTGSKKNRRRLRKSVNNPLQQGLLHFLQEKLPQSFFNSHENISLDALTSALPKRFTIYKPLLLLPGNVFSLTPQWENFYLVLDDYEKHRLYKSIVHAFSGLGVTHVAMNAPISLTTPEGDENIVRSPSGLVPLLGDFGPLPAALAANTAGVNLCPTEEELGSTLWVHATQNGGVAQVWAPLYTMFSRGNIVEKARILGLSSRFDGLDDSLNDVAVVDMYAGIGYFVFSYLKRGVKRVWAFDINGWSLEGLRRGCRLNGWGTKTMLLGKSGQPASDLTDFVSGLTDEDRVVIFHGSNEFTIPIMTQVKEIMTKLNSWTPIRHVNLGLLPSSRTSWPAAVCIMDKRLGGWSHVHENVDIHEMELMGCNIVKSFRSLIKSNDIEHDSVDISDVTCCHVEQVKTYAPGVMHCVYDIHIPPACGHANE
ncbi:hypothetical protein KEM54_006476 [Ascosphaera aggregata]|nr:hypothetical protein KEM54_006476 [Ascosphaera aggregata]